MNELAMLAQALEDAGISPEELEAAAAAKHAEEIRKRVRTAKSAEQKPAWQPKTAEEARRYQALLKSIMDITGKG